MPVELRGAEYLNRGMQGGGVLSGRDGIASRLYRAGVRFSRLAGGVAEGQEAVDGGGGGGVGYGRVRVSAMASWQRVVSPRRWAAAMRWALKRQRVLGPGISAVPKRSRK